MNESAGDSTTRRRGPLVLSVAVLAVLAVLAVVAAVSWFVFAGDDSTSSGTPTGASIETVEISADIDKVVAISEDGGAIAWLDGNDSVCREWIVDNGPANEDLVCTEVEERLVATSPQVSWPDGERPVFFDNARVGLDSYVVAFEDAKAFALPLFEGSQPARAYQDEIGAMVFWDQELIETGPAGEAVNRYPNVSTPPMSITWLADGTVLADQSGTDGVIQIRDGQSTVVHTGEQSTLLLDASPTGDAALVLDRKKVILLSPAPALIVNFDTGSAATLPLPDEGAIFLDAWFSQDETMVFGVWASFVDDGNRNTISVIELDGDREATSDWITLHEWQQDEPIPLPGAEFGHSDTGTTYLTLDGVARVVFTYD